MGTGLSEKLQALIPKFWECPKCQEAVRPWKTVGAGLLAVLALAFFLNRSHRAMGDALRDAEAAKLALAQQLVAEQGSKADVQASMKDLLAQDELLREAYEAAMKAAPDAKVESTAKLVTAPARALAKAEPVPEPVSEPDKAHPPALPPCDRPYIPDGHGGFSCPEAPAPKKTACLFDTGSLGSFKVDEIVLGTDAGNKLVTGTAEFWREAPGSRSKLAAGKFASALSDIDTVAPPAPPRWGGELGVLCTHDGCGLGGGVLLPPFRVPLLGLQGEARTDLYAGPVLGASAWLGVRW